MRQENAASEPTAFLTMLFSKVAFQKQGISAIITMTKFNEVCLMSIEMKKPTQRSISALETQNTIFNVAIKLFSKYGYDKVTIEDVAKHSNISKGNFYNHFNSKDSVLVEQFRRIDAHYLEVFEKVSIDESASNKLRILINAMCDYVEHVCGINAIQVVYANQISQNKHIKILNNEDRPFYTLIHEIITQGQNNGEFRCDINSAELVNLISRGCRGLLYDWCLYNDTFDLQTEGVRSTDHMLDFLRKEKGKA